MLPTVSISWRWDGTPYTLSDEDTCKLCRYYYDSVKTGLDMSVDESYHFRSELWEMRFYASNRIKLIYRDNPEFVFVIGSEQYFGEPLSYYEINGASHYFKEDFHYKSYEDIAETIQHIKSLTHSQIADMITLAKTK